MTTKLSVDDVVELKNGKIILAVTILEGSPVSAGMVGRSISANLEIQVVSVALVNSPPAPANKQGLSVQLTKGSVHDLKASVVLFE